MFILTFVILMKDMPHVRTRTCVATSTFLCLNAKAAINHYIGIIS